MGVNGVQGFEKLSAPISVFLNMTQECNMRCTYCYAEAERPRRRQENEMTDEEYLGLVDQLIEARVFKYAITGGEPFLRRDLVFEILDRIANRGHVMLFTNATMIREEDARRLATFPGRFKAFVSIDAPVEEVNAVTRGKGFLKKTMRGVKRLMDQGLVPDINCVLSRVNYKLIPLLIDFLKEHRLKTLHIIHFQPLGYGAELTQELALRPQEKIAFSSMVEQLSRTEKEVEVVAQDDENWSGFEEIHSKCQSCGQEEGKPDHLLPCSAGAEQCNITADGWVTPCNYMLSYRCGNVREKPFLDIWHNSPELQRIRHLRKVPVTAVPECSDCKYNIFCRGGCRAIGLVTSGSLLGLDISCPYYESQSSSAIHLPLIH